MVVAALQAINGVNLFGAHGGPSSIIHALPDEITRNYTTLHSALPRESNSKEIDGALLSIIGYPAFAVHDKKLLNRTRTEIETKLKGKYGCKRFLRDGHQTVLEDTRRLHYDSHELKVFEHVECEWPLFFVYFILDGLFSENEEQVKEYREALKKCLVDSESIQQRHQQQQQPSTPQEQPTAVQHTEVSPTNSILVSPAAVNNTHSNTVNTLPKQHRLPPNIPLVPELFIVPKHLVEAEKKAPNSQQRVPNENVPLVWAQSLYMLSELMFEGLLSTNEIDPLGLHLLPNSRSQKPDTIVQVVLIAENEDLQSRLSTFGIDTQTPRQAAPVTILRPSALVDAFSVLGANSKLGLSGRPKRPVGTLGTSKVYRVDGQLYAFTPHFMDNEEFYLAMDTEYLVSLLQHELVFIKNNWWSTGRPTMVIYLTQLMAESILQQKTTTTTVPSDDLSNALSPDSQKFSFMLSKNKNSMLNLIHSLKSGTCGSVRVRLGRMQELIGTSCIESLDFLTAKLDQGYLTRNHVHLNWKDVLDTGSGSNNSQSGLSAHCYLLGSQQSTKSRVKRKVSLRRMLSPLMAPTDVNSSSMESLSLAAPQSSETPVNVTNDVTTPLKREKSKRSRAKSSQGEYKLKSESTFDSNDTLPPPSPVIVLPRKFSEHQNRSPSPAKAGQLVLEFGNPQMLTAAVDFLSTSGSLQEQIELLDYIRSCHSDLTCVLNLKENGKATVLELLEEVYQKSSKVQLTR